MELEKIDNNEAQIEELTKNETTDLFRSIVMGMDVTEWIDTSKGRFKVKFPRARDLENAGKLTAMRLSGIPAISIERNIYDFIENIAYLDTCIIDWPDWWKLAKKDNPNFGWRDIPSYDFIMEVYAKAYKFREKIQIQIDGDKKEANKGLDNNGASDNSSEPGLFDNLSDSAEFNG